eukprot:308153-Chlamydomonas_euryale.AAC.1
MNRQMDATRNSKSLSTGTSVAWPRASCSIIAGSHDSPTETSVSRPQLSLRSLSNCGHGAQGVRCVSVCVCVCVREGGARAKTDRGECVEAPCKCRWRKTDRHQHIQALGVHQRRRCNP